MSTKSTIAHGKDFHFYRECMDEDNVYLELEGESLKEFEVSNGHIMVAVPAEIWLTIRQSGDIDLSFADKTDEEILAYVEQQVDARLIDWEQYKEKCKADGTESVLTFYSLMGSGVYGGMDEPREDQINQGVKYFEFQRERQKKIKDKMSTYEITDGKVFLFNFNEGTCQELTEDTKL